MDAHLTEWLNLGIRWIHMIVGIAWIGASFYFVWLENNLNRSNPREGLSGDLWAIHGGGIYHLEKYKLAPPQMPENLHWFKWEAYTTWLSGVALLMVVYYLNPSLYLIAPGSELSPAAAIAIGFGSLIVGWFIYDLLCDSPLGKTPALLGLVLFVLVIAACWGYSQIFSGRAAYIHTGALIGTIMVGNVFRIIMPAQRALVAAIEQNRTPDPVLPAKGLLRSRHNNYFTLPVLFIMISNHFPSTYGSQYNWLILAALGALSVLARHYFNTRHDSNRFAWALPAAAVGMICLAFVTSPNRQPAAPNLAATTPEQASQAAQQQPQQAVERPATAAAGDGVAFAEVSNVIHERCTVCHSAQPTSPLFSAAPAGVMFDTPQQMRQQAAKIHAQTVASQIMPLGNITQMTTEERQLIGQWIAQGAHTE
ncbi:urate hydroxylase PuuD [Pseudomonas lopnurensis]|uniref:urate hydroxylase PuuD n=1 Tax=Pseudomonas lopnurensis TaxID=1477517 RepID=UPI00187AC04E|nr:urate hydroxylase PuuD [Pseudomonas lopnurensis]MBE7375515.1 urate hydroxylase PuuD [Pseudomonas lopnurensis]